MSRFELGPLQRRQWRLRPGLDRSPYWSQLTLAVEGVIDLDRLRAAARGVVRRHEILRTRFEEAGFTSLPIQVVGKEPEFETAALDLSGLNDIQVHSELRRAARKQTERSCSAALSVVAAGGGADGSFIIITTPSILCDGRGLRNLAGELLDLYSGGGRPDDDLLQYADVCAWQYELLEDDGLEDGRRYWERSGHRGGLRGLPFRGPGTGAFSPARVGVSIVPQLWDEIESACERRDLPAEDVLLSLWSILLARYLGEEVVIGVLADGRDFAELEETVGLLARYLPTGLTVDPAGSLRETAEIVSGNRLEHRKKQQFFVWPDTGSAGGAGSYPSICFEYSGGPVPGDGGARATEIESSSYVDRFDVLLRCARLGKSMNVELSFNADAIDETDASSLLSQYTTALGQVGTMFERPVDELRFTNDAECSPPSTGVSGVERTLCAGDYVPVHCAFERLAESNPDRVAVVEESRSYTYGQMNRWSNDLAGALIERGVAPGSLVAVCLDRCAAAVASLLAVLKTGCAYVPVDPGQPPARLAKMLADAGVDAVMTPPEPPRSLPSSIANTVEVALEWTPDSGDAASPQFPVKGTDLAYVIYTSGTSGAPKGVEVEHRQLSRYVAAITEAIGLEEGLGFATGSSFSADLAYTALYPALVSGGTFHVFSAEQVLNPVYLSGYFSEHSIDVLKIAPSHLGALLDGAEVLPRKVLVLGGEKFPLELLQRIRDTNPALDVVNHYGPTETTVGAAFYRCSRDAPGYPVESVPIGGPIGGAGLHVLDTQLRSVADWMRGELYISGPGLARGYHGDAALTSSRFMGAGETGIGARLYRTGDIVRRLPDGTLEYLERGDEQIKLHGHRVEPGEIRAALDSQPDVASSEVVYFPEEADTNEDHLLVGYVVARDPKVDHDDFEASLLSRLQEILPTGFVPSRIVTLKNIPLTTGGKVDRKALVRPAAARHYAKPNYAAPSTEIEEHLAAIWARVLHLDRVSVDDNFFELGGDSIHSIQVVGQAYRLGLRLAPSQIFEHPTVRLLASVVQHTRGGTGRRESGSPEGPLTPIQHWFFEMAAENPHHYNMARMLVLERTLDAGALQRAFDQLVEHHDALRARFVRKDGGWMQFSDSDTEVPIYRHDLSGLDTEQQQSEVDRLCRQVSGRLNVFNGPTLAAAYFEMGAGKRDRLFVTVHHLAIDGFSWGPLLEDFSRAVAADTRCELPQGTASHMQWAAALEDAAVANSVVEDYRYWKDVRWDTAQLPPTDFECDDRAMRMESVDSLTTSINEQVSRAATRDIPIKLGIRSEDFLLAALFGAFVHWSGQRCFLVDVEKHGRHMEGVDMDVSRTIGWFTTRYPLLLRLDDEDDGSDVAPLLTVVRRENGKVPREGASHGLLTYLCDDSEIRGCMKNLPQPRISFNYLGRMDESPSGAAVIHSSRVWTTGSVDPGLRRWFYLKIAARIENEMLQLEWNYSGRLYRASTIEYLGELYERYLTALVKEYTSGKYRRVMASEFPQARISQEELDRFMVG